MDDGEVGEWFMTNSTGVHANDVNKVTGSHDNAASEECQ